MDRSGRRGVAGLCRLVPDSGPRVQHHHRDRRHDRDLRPAPRRAVLPVRGEAFAQRPAGLGPRRRRSLRLGAGTGGVDLLRGLARHRGPLPFAGRRRLPHLPAAGHRRRRGVPRFRPSGALVAGPRPRGRAARRLPVHHLVVHLPPGAGRGRPRLVRVLALARLPRRRRGAGGHGPARRVAGTRGSCVTVAALHRSGADGGSRQCVRVAGGPRGVHHRGLGGPRMDHGLRRHRRRRPLRPQRGQSGRVPRRRDPARPAAARTSPSHLACSSSRHGSGPATWASPR